MNYKNQNCMPALIRTLLILAVGLLLLIGLTSCANEEPPATVDWVLALRATKTEMALNPPATKTPQPSATPTKEPTPTSEPTATPTEEVVGEACIGCHSDKERLISLAKPEEPAEEEFKGVG